MDLKPLGTDFSALVQALSATHQQMQSQAARSVDTALVLRNWLFGWHLVEFENASAKRQEVYGKNLVDKLSAALTSHGIKGVSPTNLRLCRSFYEAFQKIQQTASVESLAAATWPPDLNALKAQLSLGWSHYVVLLSVSNLQARSFYEVEAQQGSWGVRELKRQIASGLFERLALSRSKDEVRALAQVGQMLAKPADVIKNPYVLEFLDLPDHPSYSEHQLELAIIDKLEHFLLELGKGFLFEARQKRFTFDDNHFYVDLVFYNRLLRCYVVIDLKIGQLTHQDLGQMQMYVNYFDRHVKTAEEAPTVGILLCYDKNDALVELTLPQSSNIYAAQYQLYLPSKEELRQKIQEAEKAWEAAQ
ncbi:PDDEXK nuclease domain-containing protein [Comamonas sediminis]|uniref:YhcG family protein n=1 Tax=Comamonas sediminis TaxID=1783360 RepID=A0ABV4B897_9BURK